MRGGNRETHALETGISRRQEERGSRREHRKDRAHSIEGINKGPLEHRDTRLRKRLVVPPAARHAYGTTPPPGNEGQLRGAVCFPAKHFVFSSSRGRNRYDCDECKTNSANAYRKLYSPDSMLLACATGVWIATCYVRVRIECTPCDVAMKYFLFPSLRTRPRFLKRIPRACFAFLLPLSNFVGFSSSNGLCCSLEPRNVTLILTSRRYIEPATFSCECIYSTAGTRGIVRIQTRKEMIAHASDGRKFDSCSCITFSALSPSILRFLSCMCMEIKKNVSII